MANDISLMLVSVFVAYYASKGHKPKWIAAGLLMLSAFCIMFSLPHFIYGAPDVLQYTEEYEITSSERNFDFHVEAEKRKLLCNVNSTLATTCDAQVNDWGPTTIFFCAQLVAGVGAALYSSLGVIYIDDNVKKSKSPLLLSEFFLAFFDRSFQNLHSKIFLGVSFFLKMLGPACGYTLASYSLKHYVYPSLHPTITTADQRWIGAWWLGWLVIGVLLAVGAFAIGMFPRSLPRAAARKEYLELKQKEEGAVQEKTVEEKTDDLPASVNDLMATLKRLLKNKILMNNHFASVFYMFGFTPYWIFTPKYIETQYKKSASSAK